MKMNQDTKYEMLLKFAVLTGNKATIKDLSKELEKIGATKYGYLRQVFSGAKISKKLAKEIADACGVEMEDYFDKVVKNEE